MTTQRKTIIGALVALVIIIAFIVLYPRFAAPSNTTYAPGFSEAAFKLITVGMSGADVQNRLGTPLKIETHGKTSNVEYSQPTHGRGYFEERTIVEQNNAVTAVRSGITN